MKNFKNDYCIRMFTDYRNEIRPAFNQVNLNDNGFLYASDAHILAKIDSKYCVKQYKNEESYPNAEKIFQDLETTKETVFKTDELFNQLMHIDICFRPNLERCDECGGTGEIECHCCGHGSQCEDCDGKGVVDGFGIKISGPNTLSLLDRDFRIDYIDRIIRTAVILGEKEITVQINENAIRGVKFLVGNFQIILMPTSKPFLFNNDLLRNKNKNIFI